PADVNIGAEAGASLTLSGGVAGAGADLTKVGGGTLVFPAGTPANTQDRTAVSAGTVEVDGSVGPVVLDGGTLSGTGTVGAVTSSANGGTVSPGVTLPAAAVGTLNTGAVTLNQNDAFFAQLAVGTNDLLAVTGGIDLGGATLTGTSNPAIAVGDKFTIVTAASVVGHFAGPGTSPLEPGAGSATVAFINGTKYVVDYFTDHVTLVRERVNVTMTLAPSVPAPAYGQ